MIVDNLLNVKTYCGINANLTKALEFLKNTDFNTVEQGTRFEIDKNHITAWYGTVEKKPLETHKWEAHKMYGDIHLVVEGEEDFGYDYRSEDSNSLDYNEKGDYVYEQDGGNFVKLKAGDFIVVFPQEPHMPAVTFNESKKVKKVVLKFLMD